MSASMKHVIFQASRLTCGSLNHGLRKFSVQSAPLAFQATPALWSEPAKKLRKVNPQVIRDRFMKKKRKLEKAMRKLSLKGRTLKPVDEIEGNYEVFKTLEERKRIAEPASFDEMEERALLTKQWQRYKLSEHISETKKVERMLMAQEEALRELRIESEELYQQAITLDDSLMPLDIKGPTSTPPIKNYDPPDGAYIDTTKVFDK